MEAWNIEDNINKSKKMKNHRLQVNVWLLMSNSERFDAKGVRTNMDDLVRWAHAFESNICFPQSSNIWTDADIEQEEAEPAKDDGKEYHQCCSNFIKILVI